MTYEHRGRGGRAGFTLTELVVVVAVVAVLAGILLPAVQRAREASFRVACQNNLRQVGLAMHQYVGTTGVFPSLWSYSLSWRNGQPSGSANNWTPHLLAYLEEPVSNQYDLSVMFYENTAAIATPLKVLLCPSAPHADVLTTETNWMPSQVTEEPALSVIDPYFTATFRAALTDYTGFTRLSDDWKDLLGYPPETPELVGVLAAPPFPTAGQVGNWLVGGSVPLQAAGRRPGEITDGLSYSILLIEEGGRPQLWTNGRLVSGVPPVRYAGWADPGGEFAVLQGEALSECLINCTNQNGIYSFHSGGANFALADGSVKFISRQTSTRTLVALLTASAGDTPGGDY